MTTLTVAANEVGVFDIIEGHGRVHSTQWDAEGFKVTFLVGVATRESTPHPLGGTVSYPAWSDLIEFTVDPHEPLTVHRHIDIGSEPGRCPECGCGWWEPHRSGCSEPRLNPPASFSVAHDPHAYRVPSAEQGWPDSARTPEADVDRLDLLDRVRSARGRSTMTAHSTDALDAVQQVINYCYGHSGTEDGPVASVYDEIGHMLIDALASAAADRGERT